MIIAIDLGINYGYCVKLKNNTFKSGNGTLKGADKVGSIIEFLKSISSFHGESIDLIYYERVDFSYNTYAGQAHGKYVGAIEHYCNRNNIPCKGIAVSTVKKQLTGHGNASKMGMIHYAEKFIGKDLTNDNEADAIGVMVAGLKTIG